MKKLMIAVLLLVGVSIYSQEVNARKNKKDKRSKEMKSPEKRADALLAKMTTELNLDVNQQEQIRPIIKEHAVKMGELNAQIKGNKENNVEVSKADKRKMKKKFKANIKETDNKIKEIVTPEQFVKYKAMQKAEKAKIGSKNKENAGE